MNKHTSRTSNKHTVGGVLHHELRHGAAQKRFARAFSMLHKQMSSERQPVPAQIPFPTACVGSSTFLVVHDALEFRCFPKTQSDKKKHPKIGIHRCRNHKCLVRVVFCGKNQWLVAVCLLAARCRRCRCSRRCRPRRSRQCPALPIVDAPCQHRAARVETTRRATL